MTKYLLRLDDACTKMDHKKWLIAVRIIDCLEIKPIVAVIPDNYDLALNYSHADNQFWTQVRDWQAKGWTIGMHGYQHRFHYTKGNLVPLHNRSEFSGLTLGEQRRKIRLSWNIFLKEKVRPTVWVAPAHGFDQSTIRALIMETDIRTISDGFALSSFVEYGMTWIPQQLWKFRVFPFGLFTICVHPNMMSVEQLNNLFDRIKNNRKDFVSCDEVCVATRKRSYPEKCFAYLLASMLNRMMQWKRGVK